MLILPHEHRAPFIAPGRRNRKVHWNRSLSKAIAALGKSEREDWRRALWLPESLRAFYPKWNNQFSPSGDACGCCSTGDPCALVSDDFDRANSTNLGAGWSEESGDFTISSNKLNYNSGTNAVVINTTTHTSQEVTITVDVRQGITTGTTFRIILSYVDTDNYYYAELTIGSAQTLRLVERSGGTDTELDSATVTTFAGTSYPFTACMTEFSFSATANGVSVGAAHSGTSGEFGLGIGAATGPSTFDNFVARIVSDTCDDCQRPVCYLCSEAGSADSYEVTISGLTNTDPVSSCADCASFNGTWILTRAFQCSWRYDGTFPCGNDALILDFISDGFPDTSGSMDLAFFSDPGAPAFGSNGNLSDVDCRNLVDYELPNVPGGGYCEDGSATCTITAL